jgi:hypothetical protein
MVDISSAGAAFTCHADQDCHYPDKQITARFSVPRFAEEDAFDMASFTRTGRICRVDRVSNFLNRVAVQFAEPLPFKPGEQSHSQSGTTQRLKVAALV